MSKKRTLHPVVLNPFPHTTNLVEATMKISRQKMENLCKGMRVVKTSRRKDEKVLIVGHLYFCHVFKSHLMQSPQIKSV